MLDEGAQPGGYWTRKVPRRRVLRGAAAAGLGGSAWLLAACSGNNNKNGGNANAGKAATTAGGKATATSAAFPVLTPRPTPSVQAASVPKDGILKSRQNAPFASINPYKGLDSGLLWGFTVFDHMWYTPGDTGERVLFLAKSIEQPDPTTINITLNPSVFHNKPPVNGRAVLASDVKASFEAAAAAPKISISTWWHDTLDTVTAPDDSTVIIKMKQPNAWTYSSTNAGSPIAASILPAEIAHNPDFMDNDIIGSGRYVLASQENGTNFKLQRFDKWRVPGEPWVAGINYFLIQEQSAALAAFAAQQIDSVTANNKPEADGLVSKLGNAISIERNLSASVWTVQGRADGPWADPRVRQAVNLGLDRDEFIKLMAFGDGEKSGPVPPVFKQYALDASELQTTLWKSDPAAGKQLLTAAGFDTTKEFQLKYYVPGDDVAQFAQIVQAQLQKNLGLKIKLVGQDFGTWLAKTYYTSDYDGFITYPSLAYDDPSSYLEFWLKANGPIKNSAAFFDDDLDALVRAQKTILDDAQRAEAVKAAQRKAIADAQPYIPMFVAVTNTAWWNYVKGRTVGRGSFDLYNDHFYIQK